MSMMGSTIAWSLLGACLAAPNASVADAEEIDAPDVPPGPPVIPGGVSSWQTPETVEEALLRGERAHVAGEHAQAASAYEAAYRLLRDDESKGKGKNVTSIGLYAAQSHRRAYEQSNDAAHLDAARALLEGIAERYEAAGKKTPRSILQERDLVTKASEEHVPTPTPPPDETNPLLEAASRARSDYEQLTPADKVGVGVSYVQEAVEHYCKAHELDREAAHLDSARQLLGDVALLRHARGLAVPRGIDVLRWKVQHAISNSSTCAEAPPLPPPDPPPTLAPFPTRPPGTGLFIVGLVGAGFSGFSLIAASTLHEYMGPGQWSMVGIVSAASIGLAVAGGVQRLEHRNGATRKGTRARVLLGPPATLRIHF